MSLPPSLIKPGVEGEQHLAHPAATERALGLVAGCEIDDLDVVEDRVDAGGVATAERSLIAEARVCPWTLGTSCERSLTTEAQAVVLHQKYVRSNFWS